MQMSRKKSHPIGGIERFHGFETCLKVMRSRDGQTSEEGFYWLKDHAAERLDQLVAAFHDEANEHLRYWLLELIAEAKSPDMLPLFVEYLHGPREHLRTAAFLGLVK